MSEPTQADHGGAIASILDRLGRLYEEAEATIDAINDPEDAFRYATDFAERTRTLHDEVEGRMRELRERQAGRIHAEQSLSLQGLADRIGVSKTRADQLVKAAKEQAARKG